jgi:hypothetical protein
VCGVCVRGVHVRVCVRMRACVFVIVLRPVFFGGTFLFWGGDGMNTRTLAVCICDCMFIRMYVCM